MLKIYDINIDAYREATQGDIDKMEAFIAAVDFRASALIPVDLASPEEFNFRLAIYRNPMRQDGVFVAEEKVIEPYEGISRWDGSPCYPAVPRTPYSLKYQLPHAFAWEIVRRWNRR